MAKKNSICIFFAALLLLPVSFAHSASLTENQQAAIQKTCSNIRSLIQNTRYSDTRTRTYFGKFYESIISDYMIPLNARLVKNNALDSVLTDLQSEFVTAHANFNEDFISYSRSMEELASYDCENHPNSFYTKLEESRTLRSNLLADVNELSDIIKEYRSEVSKLKETYDGK